MSATDTSPKIPKTTEENVAVKLSPVDLEPGKGPAVPVEDLSNYPHGVKLVSIMLSIFAVMFLVALVWFPLR